MIRDYNKYGDSINAVNSLGSAIIDGICIACDHTKCATCSKKVYRKLDRYY